MLVRKVGQIPPSRTPGGVATEALNPDLIKLAIAGSSPAGRRPFPDKRTARGVHPEEN